MYRQPVGILMKQITDKIKVSADASLKSRGLTLSQGRMLKFVSGHPDGVTQKAIENHFQVSHHLTPSCILHRAQQHHAGEAAYQ